MLKERNQTFKLMFIGLDLIISFLGFWAAFLLRYFIDTSFYFNTTNYIILSIVLSVTQVLAFISIDLYHPRRGLAFFDELGVIASGVVLNLLFILSLLFFFRGEIRGESFSRLFMGYYVVTSIVLTAMIHYVFRIFLMRLRERGYNLRNVIIIGTGKTAERITEVIQGHKIYGYNIVGYIKSISRTQVREDFPILGNLKDIEKILSGQRPDILIYAKEFADGENLREIIDICDHENIELKIIPEFIEFIAAKGRVEGMDGVPIISIRDIPIRMGYNRVYKTHLRFFIFTYFHSCFLTCLFVDCFLSKSYF
jgi:FlaA1/EpsC-like NDP-sugar epimerase